MPVATTVRRARPTLRAATVPHPPMHRQTIIVKVPRSFMEQVSWPEFQELNAALVACLSEITEKVIREEVH